MQQTEVLVFAECFPLVHMGIADGRAYWLG